MGTVIAPINAAVSSSHESGGFPSGALGMYVSECLSRALSGCTRENRRPSTMAYVAGGM